jgi:hypothetical protein
MGLRGLLPALLPFLLLAPGPAGAQVSFCEATGGTVSWYTTATGRVMQVHTFTASGTFTVSAAPPGGCTVEVLVVAGGGGGNGGDNSEGGGGGGGGGGLRTGFVTIAAQGHAITVGGGGLGGTDASGTEAGRKGGDSAAFGLTAIGGGGGARIGTTFTGFSGGSGGGGFRNNAGGAGTPGQGQAGGRGGGPSTSSGGGGGGGAGQVGGDGINLGGGGKGGDGTSSAITGTAVVYAGGGGGGAHAGNGGAAGAGGGGAGGSQVGGNGANGTNGRGGGGGGGARFVPPSTGGNGGTGVVIVAYQAFTSTLVGSATGGPQGRRYELWQAGTQGGATGISWNQARDEALVLAGDLASLTSAAELTFVSANLDFTGLFTAAGLGPWLGGFASTTGGAFAWLDGSPITAGTNGFQWQAGQPDFGGGAQGVVFFQDTSRFGDLATTCGRIPLAGCNFEVRGYVLERAAAAAGFRITQSGGGIYCLDHAVVVTALDAAAAPVAGYSGTVQLATGTGRGTWLLTSGSGSLVDATPDDGLATYAWNPADTSATFALRYRAGPGTVTLDATDTSNATITDDNAGTTALFSPDGFTVTAAPFTNPAGGVPAFASPQVAGAAFPVYLTAYGQTPTDPDCGIIEEYAGTRNLRFWSTYLNPATGTRAASIDGGAIATSEGASVPQAVTFTAGQAVVSARYRDAGTLAIGVKDDTTGNPALPTGIRGGTGPVVVRPADFQVSNIRRTSDAAANPGAAAASGPVFIGAGQPFSATVQAVDVDGNPTPNFGQEFPAEAVAFTPTLVLPAGGNLPAVSGIATGFANGQATGTAFRWPEVGIIRLVPAVADGDYLGAGPVTGNPTGNVGRFIPDRFGVATNTPLFATGCLTGSFTYRGQPFGYAVAPVITATAQAAEGSTTLNYAGDFFRLTAAAVGSPTYASTSGNLDTSGLPAAGADPVIAATGPGIATLTFGAGNGLALARGAPAAPVDAVISLTSPVVDLDGAAAAGPVTFGASGGIAFTAGASQRYGRLALRNALGSELLDLPMRLTTEFYAGNDLGFMTHEADSCTVAPPLTLGGYQGALAAGETCVRDTGAPGVSGAGCAAPAPPGQRYRATAQAGGFNLQLAAPGAGNQGAVTVTGDAPPFLEYDWNTATPGNENPAGFATFGVFPGPASRIYQREVY